MEKLHAALTILLRYRTEENRHEFYTSAEHDEIFFGGVPPDEMKPEDVLALEELGLHYDESLPAWKMFT